MVSIEEARRLALDDDLSAHPRGQVVVIGCGNLLRGDDAVGPILIRHLWERGVPPHVTLVDGGTAGMDVAFKMRGADRVILIDASSTGAEPGTIYRVPGSEFDELPPLDGLHTHQFRWDHALSFARWLLADDYPADIAVYLIEAAQTEHGADLSEPVERAMQHVLALLATELPAPEPTQAELTVEFTADGSMRVDADLAQRFFPSDAMVAVGHPHELLLFPLAHAESGGLLLKQRNAAGDRSVLVWESLPQPQPVGTFSAIWDETQGALRIRLNAAFTPSENS